MKGFKKKDVLKAIEQSNFTYASVAKALSLVSPDGKCSDKTAKLYIEKYGDETKEAFASGALCLRDMAIENIKKALHRGDVRTSKWVLERLERGVFGFQEEKEERAESTEQKFEFIIVDPKENQAN